MAPRWYPLADKNPPGAGKYWVFPYRNTEGDMEVILATYRNSTWEVPYAHSQELGWWQPLKIPCPPKVKINRNSEQKRSYHENRCD